ncbi:glutathione S-transferase family protein [Phreatobacter sp.]|uniref:glutathione S-transferase family protein n=1 Tax=Phreatobacter sp. TaxID=1966341 RepID=UPI003F6EEE93
MQILHRPFCPHSRFLRLVLAERGIDVDLTEERPWERRADFLRLNPEGATPVLVVADALAIPGAEIACAWLDESGTGTPSRPLLPEGPVERVEVRRLVRWFNGKFFEEVSRPLVEEKIDKRFMSPEHGGGGPNTAALRAARANIRYHLAYIGWLAARNHWLAGAEMSYADLAAAAHLSVVDYLGEVKWTEEATAREWYARVKSRPSFRTLLADRVAGMPASATYADLDF